MQNWCKSHPSYDDEWWTVRMLQTTCIATRKRLHAVPVTKDEHYYCKHYSWVYHVEYFCNSLYTLNLSSHGLSSWVLRKHDNLLPWIVPKCIMKKHKIMQKCSLEVKVLYMIFPFHTKLGGWIVALLYYRNWFFVIHRPKNIIHYLYGLKKLLTKSLECRIEGKPNC